MIIYTHQFTDALPILYTIMHIVCVCVCVCAFVRVRMCV